MYIVYNIIYELNVYNIYYYGHIQINACIPITKFGRIFILAMIPF